MKKRNVFLTFLDGIYLKNPVLSLFLGLTLAVICTTSVQTALYISAIVLVDMLVVEVFCSIFKKKIGKVLAYVLSAIISATISVLAVLLLSAFYPLVVINGLSVYTSQIIVSFIPFVATTSAVLVKGQKATDLTVGQSIADALGSGIGFAIALFIIAFLREMIGTGEIFFVISETETYTLKIMDWTLPVVLNPFMGLIFTGAACGFHASICKTYEDRKAMKKGGAC